MAENDICASSGSACNSQSGEVSHVLKAIGLSDEEANATLRFSFDADNTVDLVGGGDVAGWGDHYDDFKDGKYDPATKTISYDVVYAGMDFKELQNTIVSRPEYIEQLLDTMGFENIQDKGEYYSCQNIGGDNPHAIAIYKDNLHYENFSHGSRGNLLTLVMETKGCSFPESIEYTAKTLGIKSQNIRVVLPFGGFYKDIIRSESDSILDMKHYAERDLPPADALSYKFLKDGVSLEIQQQVLFSDNLHLSSS